MGAVIVDVCGGSRHLDAFADTGDGGVGVAGTIRLDGRQGLARELAGVDPSVDAGTDIGEAGLVVAAYRRWGRGAFSRLSGEFALALWDRDADCLYLVRDQFGVRRLHFASQNRRVIFSTEIEGVLAWPKVPRDVDDVTILDNLLGRYQSRTRTYFQAVRRVVPGHASRFSSSGESATRYAEPPARAAEFASGPEYAEALRHELALAVAERVPGSGKIVCQLSGGLDSTFIAALAAAYLRGNGRAGDLVLANAAFPGLLCDETELAARVARALGAPVESWNGLEPENSDLDHPRLAWPFGRSSIAGSVSGDLDCADRVSASILLSGQGGNQITHQYGYFRDAWRAGGIAGYGGAILRFLEARPWGWPRPHLATTLGDARQALWPRFVRDRRLRQANLLFQDPPPWLGSRGAAAWSTLRQETEPSLPREPITGSWMADSIWEAVTDDPRHVWTLELEDARATERGKELRYPFLSWSLLGLMISVPWALRAPQRLSRALHREAMKAIVADEVRLRTSFVYFNEANMANFQGAAAQTQEVLSRGTWRAGAFVSQKSISNVFSSLLSRAHQPFTFEDGEGWRLVRDVAALEVWLEKFSC